MTLGVNRIKSQNQDGKEVGKMENYQYKTVFKDLVRFVSRGYSQRYIDNPLECLEREKKRGKYDDISQSRYNKMIEEATKVSCFWSSLRNKSVIELLKTVLENIDFSEEQLDELGEILSVAYENTNHESIPSSVVPKEAMPDQVMMYEGVMESQPSGTFDTLENEIEECWYDMMQTPKKIYDYLSEGVYGQEDAKKAAAMLLWNHVNGRKQNMIFAGPTGCGKTEIFRQLQKIYPYIAIYDANSLTGEGWKGNMKVRNLFDGFSAKQAEHLIIVLDEADKLFEQNGSCYGGTIVQNELLKIMEGDMVHFEGDPQHAKEVPTLDIDTANVSFVFLGSFETMLKTKNRERTQNIGFLSDDSFDGKEMDYHTIFTSTDLVEYANVRTEIAGRITKIVQLKPLMQEDFFAILNDAKMSPIKKLEECYHISIRMEDNSKRLLAQEAEENRMGVRYMKSKLQTLLNEQIFQNCEKEEYLIQ